MYLKAIGDIISMMVIYLLLYTAQFQSLPDSFRIIALHYMITFIRWYVRCTDVYGGANGKSAKKKIEDKWKAA